MTVSPPATFAAHFRWSVRSVAEYEISASQGVATTAPTPPFAAAASFESKAAAGPELRGHAHAQKSGV